MKYKHIIWDWNGTLLNDRWVCVNGINNCLKKRGLSSISEETYKSIFTFPVKDYYKKLGFDFNYLPSAIDTDKLDNIDDVIKLEKQIIYLGRNSYEKGFDILKKIESKLDGNIIYCTDLLWEDAMIELKKSSLLVVPSRMESLPTNIKEAFYFKIPVIATDVGGIPELIINNYSGILVPSGNDAKLVTAINDILSDSERSISIANAGYDFIINNLTWKKVLPKYIDFYTNLLNS